MIVLHAGAGAMIFAVDLPIAMRWGLLLALSLSLFLTLMHHALRRGRGSVRALRLEPAELGLLIQPRRIWIEAPIRSRFIHRWIVLLTLRVRGRRWPMALVLPADAIEPDLFRRLRVALLAPRRNPEE